MTVEGDAIDSPPKSFTKPCRQDYRLLMYSEANSTPPERLLKFAKQLIVKILKEEEALKDVPLTEDNILDFSLPDFSDKDERYKSCLAFIYTKCGDYLFALGEFDSAQNAYNKALKCSSLLDKHTAAACRGLSALIWSRADDSASLGSAIKYLETAVVAAGSPDFLQKHADELSSLDVAASLANELLSGSDSDRIPNQEFLSAEIELGALYAKIGEREKGLSTLLKALKALYATEQASVEGVPARDKVDMLFRANTADETKAKFYIAELLLKFGLEDEAYDWAKMAYEIALGTYEFHVESAQIARTSLEIMARIEKMKGELELAEKHEKIARRIYVPVVQEKFCYGWRL
ncbi:hypothetical protein BZA70DRAFT_289452 [Myxozyma melibiosi]|uniref:Uncharacterized protein n=1 Tax=Myxozyma melibiosi TaxID=54550 RepID=A0ABR1F6T5_9ASCO